MVSAHRRDMDISMDLQNLTVTSSKRGQLSKSLSRSTPSIAAGLQTLSTRSTSTQSLSTTISSSREKKFRKYFRQVPIDEPLLYYYNCALVRDILLQGHLYITPNYFGFHSNIFGYVTKLLIPMASVIEISKHKTVKIIPNAIAIATEESKHIFCSLYWKESTFNRIRQVWEDTKARESVADSLDGEDLLADDFETNLEQDNSDILETNSETDETLRPLTSTNTDGYSASISRPVPTMTRLENYWPNAVTTIIVVLLVALYISAAMMMVRVDRLHASYLNKLASFT